MLHLWEFELSNFKTYKNIPHTHFKNHSVLLNNKDKEEIGNRNQGGESPSNIYLIPFLKIPLIKKNRFIVMVRIKNKLSLNLWILFYFCESPFIKQDRLLISSFANDCFFKSRIFVTDDWNLTNQQFNLNIILWSISSIFSRLS